jgi:predicted tellurium resistance membrane protein TerC
MIELLLLIIVLVLLFGAEATREMIVSLAYLAISIALFLLVIGIVVGLGYAVIANYRDIYIFIKDNYSELFWALMTMTVGIDMYTRKKDKKQPD